MKKKRFVSLSVLTAIGIGMILTACGASDPKAELEKLYNDTGLDPINIPHAVTIYKNLGLEFPVNQESYINQWNDTLYLQQYTAETKGFFVSLFAENDCKGNFYRVHLELRKYLDGDWKMVDRLDLEDVSFSTSGSHVYDINGNSILLTYTQGSLCEEDTISVK